MLMTFLGSIDKMNWRSARFNQDKEQKPEKAMSKASRQF